MSSIFGTDGVRDVVGEGYLESDSVRAIGRAIARTLGEREDFTRDVPAERGRLVVIGRDTRASGPELHALLGSELRAAGHEVADLGVLPTAAVAQFGAGCPEACLGIVLSASHNPAEYNGVKLMSVRGSKISPAFEERVSEHYHAGLGPPEAPAHGRELDLSAEAFASYTEFLLGAVSDPDRLRGRRIVVDAAHGAAYRVAPAIFERLGAELVLIGVSPDGENINEGCGATAPEALARRVVEEGAALGFAFDGDADRMIPVGAAGSIFDGDHVLALAARAYRRRGELSGDAVVSTVMANLGLEKALEAEGCRLLRTAVGDRNVVAAMEEGGYAIGGEQSGHLVFLRDLGTGDGLLAALRLIDVLESEELDLEREARIVTKFPQRLDNVRVSQRIPLEDLPATTGLIREAEEKLTGSGRVVVRYSGTEPLLRVMIEGEDQELIAQLAAAICREAEREVGAVAGSAAER